MKYRYFAKSVPFHQAAISDDTDVAALITGAGYGKSFALINEVIRQVLLFGRRKGNELPYLAIILEPTYPMVRDVAIPIFFEFFPQSKIRSWSKTESKLVTVDGAEIHFRSAERIDRIRGTRPNLIALDEARDMSEYVFRLCLNRVSFRHGKVLVTTTPDGFDWTYDQIELQAQNNARIKCFRATAYDNPLFDRDLLKRQVDLIGEDLYQQEVLGERIRFSGRVYRNFDPAIHVDATNYSADYPVAVACDFNVDPISAVLMHPLGSVKSPIGWQVFDEAVLRHSDTDELCSEILHRYPKHSGGWSIYPDPAGRASHTSSRGRSDHSILAEYFGGNAVKSPRRAPPVRDRIAGLNRLFRHGHDKKEEPHFFIDPRCKVLIKGLTAVAWKGNAPDEQIFEGHITAALGYAEAYERPFSTKGIEVIERPRKRE